MQQWEYQTTVLAAQDLREALAGAGVQGWELVAVHPTAVKLGRLDDARAGFLLIYKRPTVTHDHSPSERRRPGLPEHLDRPNNGAHR